MKNLVQLLAYSGYIFGLVSFIFVIILLITKITYHPPNMRAAAADKSHRVGSFFGFFMVASSICFGGAKEVIKKEFENTLKERKIISLEINDFFLSQDESVTLFQKFESVEIRTQGKSFTGVINLEDSEVIPIKIITHHYDKNRYTIVSEKYDYLEADIGDIETPKLRIITDTIQ
jgi:hypothetical protein